MSTPSNSRRYCGVVGLGLQYLLVALCHLVAADAAPASDAGTPTSDAYCTIAFDTFTPPTGHKGIAVGSPKQWVHWPPHLGEHPKEGLRLTLPWRTMDNDPVQDPRHLFQESADTFCIYKIAADAFQVPAEQQIPVTLYERVDLAESAISLDQAIRLEETGLSLLDTSGQILTLDAQLAFYEKAAAEGHFRSLALLRALLKLQPPGASAKDENALRILRVLIGLLDDTAVPDYVSKVAFQALYRSTARVGVAGSLLDHSVGYLHRLISDPLRLPMASLNAYFEALELPDPKDAPQTKESLQKLATHLQELTKRLADLDSKMAADPSLKKSVDMNLKTLVASEVKRCGADLSHLLAGLPTAKPNDANQ